MAKETFGCSDCGYSAFKWFGRCPECDGWSTAGSWGSAGEGAAAVTTLAEAGIDPPRSETGIAELDRVLGGGLVRGSAVLLAGEPGIGKSTLVLQLLDGLVRKGTEVLLLSGEESTEQVASRAARLGCKGNAIRIASSTSLSTLLATCAQVKPTVVVIDSVQTLVNEELDQGAGSVTQVRDCVTSLVRLAKETATTVVLVGHVTKEGAVAGPKTLEHVVDVVLALDGERSGTLRLLRATKNRFGATDETGVFVMSPAGLEPVADPSALLLEDRREGVPGSVVFPSIEGSRPVLVEVQALVAPGGAARRIAIGFDGRRLSVIAGVLSTRADLALGEKDVFVAAAGGLALREPAADLAVCLALLSAARDVPLDPGTVAIGEVGLGGEVRSVPSIERRLSESARMGFTTALVPRRFDGSVPTRIRVVNVGDIVSAFDAGRSLRVAV